MPDRSDEIGRFLSEAGWGAADVVRIAGDMSARRYWRLSIAGRSAILMDADASMAPFLTMTDWLARLDLSVPGIIAAQPEAGLILMEDFGNVSLKAALAEDPELETDVFGSCVDLLLHIRAAKPPRLSRPTAAELVEWTRLADDHYPGVCAEGLSGFRKVLEDVLRELLRGDFSVSLRDYHTENMMWLPRRAGRRRLGLLDYQDAFLTHPAYDLVSLLTDARKPVARALRERVLDSYLARSRDDPTSFKRAFAALSAQRNLRILGIFARAGRYAEHLPNTYGYFLEALEHPVFDHVRSDTLAALPAPAGAS